MLIASALIVLALIAGLFCNRYLRRRAGDDEAPSITDLISPLETLAVLLLAFVLVGAAESYSEAEDSAAAEALMVDHLFETADYTSERHREPLQADTVCYARAVLHYSWPAMQNGTETSVPSIWTTDLRKHFKEMASDTDGANDTVFEILVNTDRDRSQARQTRVSESTPAIPDIVYWFMALTLAITVAAYAYSVRLCRGRGHLIAVTMLTTLFVASLLLIRDVDTPYGGPIRIEPAAMLSTEQDITEDFAKEYGLARLPCDETGNRTQN